MIELILESGNVSHIYKLGITLSNRLSNASIFDTFSFGANDIINNAVELQTNITLPMDTFIVYRKEIRENLTILYIKPFNEDKYNSLISFILK